ncbi:polysaccharide biosynthesis protein [Anaerospora sp.]|uniref:polysaccharide biosynthesis protein n=1 Tax=Anaerospora sp. TaxID=1960278 RepID=UPI0037BEB688
MSSLRQKLITGSLVLLDTIIITVAPYLALLLRFEGIIGSRQYQMVYEYLPGIILIRLLTFYFFGLYNRLWRYASIHELLAIVSAVTVSSVFVFIYMFGMGSKLPRSIPIITWLIVVALVGLSRLFLRVLYMLRKTRKASCSKVLIIGAGDAGAMIARELRQRFYDTKNLIGFIDDDRNKIKNKLFGVPVLGNCDDLPQVVCKYGVTEIIIAIPSANGERLREIFKACRETKCTVKTVPGLYEIIDGQVTVDQLRNIDLEDILRREPVKLDLDQIAGYLTRKRVLVTGAGGSIGSELCRQIARMSPSQITLVGKGENSIYEIHQELTAKFPKLSIEPVIADVRDKHRIFNIFSRVQPQVVFHAAAHKHVPLMEAQPEEAVRNNIFGTQTVAEAADRANAEKFVLISTDKAVNPTSVMGATKRVAEMIIQNMNRISNTSFVAVRFGNVLGSRGSVIPLFKKQILKGGPITITHPDMKRYFMTIPEASQLVLQAGALAQGGEVFVLDMGEPIKIVDMATDLIELSGLEPGRDIEIQFSGLRPGEKLFEELLTAEEGTSSTKHEKIYVANLKAVDERKFQESLMLLKSEMQNNVIIHMLTDLIPTYRNSKVEYCRVTKADSLSDQSNESSADYQVVSNLS